MQLSLSIQKSTKNQIRFSDKLYLKLQRLFSHGLFFIYGPLISFVAFKVFRIGVENLNEIRKKYQAILNEEEGPLIVCSNHLTMVDSFIQSAFLNSVWGYLTNYRSLPWNLPEKTKFYHKWYFGVICYLGKCVPVVRGAPRAEGKRSLEKMLYILDQGDVLAIFPEGRRSRSGRVDTEDFSYGVGQILKHRQARVLCVYLRGKKAGDFGNFPIKGEDFYFDMALICPSSDLKGLRQVRDYSTQIIKTLQGMEEEYFNSEYIDRQ